MVFNNTLKRKKHDLTVKEENLNHNHLLTTTELQIRHPKHAYQVQATQINKATVN